MCACLGHLRSLAQVRCVYGPARPTRIDQVCQDVVGIFGNLLLGGLLRWCPSSRMTAVEAGSHIYWSAASQPTSEKKVGGCSPSSQASGAEAGVPPLSSQASIETMSLGGVGRFCGPSSRLATGRQSRTSWEEPCVFKCCVARGQPLQGLQVR